MGCEARREGEQMRCVRCRLVWDRDDPEPPECGRAVLVKSPPLAPEPGGFVSGAYRPVR